MILNKNIWLWTCLLLVSVSACDVSSKDNRVVTIEDEIKATLEKQNNRIDQIKQLQTQHFSDLITMVESEPRDENWAQAKESDLSASYLADQSLPKEGLKTLRCKTTLCELQVDLSNIRDVEKIALLHQQVEQWIAWKQRCGYTLLADEIAQSTAPSLRIILDCSS